jgi:acyl carrier protein
MSTLHEVKTIVSDVLQLGERGAHLDASTSLLGSLPELDSIAVVGVITAIEEYYGIAFADDEISADTFATLGSLSSFVDQKLND